VAEIDRDSWAAMLAAVQAFHDKHRFRETGGEEMTYRVALMAEELGEISACVTKGRPRDELAEEVADLLILVMGTAIAQDFDLNQAFWDKMAQLMQRRSRFIDGRIRVRGRLIVHLVILDRDGVVNEDSDAYIKSAEEWIPIPGSLEAIARLNHAGYRVVIATNQSGVARGLFGMAELDAIHQKLHAALARLGGQVDGIYFCPHGPDDGCNCRKPRPGLLQEIGVRHGIDLTGVPTIGDSLRDLEAARAVGATPVLVRTGKGRSAERQLPADWHPVAIYDDLAEAVQALLATVAK